MPLQNPLSTRPKIFVASSAEGHAVAEILEAGLDDVAEVTTWCEGLSAALSPAWDAVVDVAAPFDFAIFVLHRGWEADLLVPLGVFIGALGRERIAIVRPISGALELPPDLSGAITATYALPPDGAVRDALGPVCTTIKEHLRRLTPPVARRLRRSLGTACSVGPGRTLRIADISLTGALLETFGEIPVNQLLDLDLALENGCRVRVTAQVVRIQHPQWGRVGGVGVQFVRFEGDSRSILERFLETDPAQACATSSPPRSPAPPA